MSMSMEKISATSKLMDLKRICISKKLQSLNNDWHELEEHLDSSEKAINEALLELQAKEDDLNSNKKEVDQLLKNSVESRCAELERKEALLSLIQMSRDEYLRARENQMKVVIEFHQGRWNELLRREKEAEDLAVQSSRKTQDLNVKDAVLRHRSKRLDSIQKQNEEGERIVGLKSKDLDYKKIYIDNAVASFKDSVRRFHLKEKELKLKVEKLALQKLELDSKAKEIEQIERSLEQSFKEVEVEKNQLHQQKRDLELKEMIYNNGPAATDNIISLLETVAEDDRIFGLFAMPSFTVMIPGFIDRLIEKTKYLVAVKFICKLDLAVKFPPVPLLKEHINLWKNIADATCEFGNNTVEAKNKALNSRITSIEKVIQCVVEYNLQSQFPLSELENDLKELSKQRRPENNDIVTHFLANMDKRHLFHFLSKHSTFLRLMEDNVSKVLNMSPESGRIVILTIMKECLGNNNILRCRMRSYLFVLEILLVGQIVPIEIIKSPDVLDATMKVALEWKLNLALKMYDPLYILAFLQLICTYKLTADFDPSELYHLCCYVSDDCGGDVLQLSEILSSSDKVPVSKILKIDQDKIYQPRKTLSDPLRHRSVPDLFRLSSHPARLLLDAMRGCFDSNIKDAKGAKSNMEVFLPLLKEFTNSDVKMDIHKTIQAEAFNLVVDWKPKILFTNTLSEVEAVCFLLFLSLFKLASWFDHEELLRLLHHCKNKFTGFILSDLGLEQKTLEFVQKVITQGRHLKAFNCIYEFNLVEKISPIDVLKSYLQCVIEDANTICHPNFFNEKELVATQAVVKCIVARGLQSSFQLKPLMERVAELLLEKAAGENNVTQNQVGEKKRQAPLMYYSNSEAHMDKKICNGASSSRNNRIGYDID